MKINITANPMTKTPPTNDNVVVDPLVVWKMSVKPLKIFVKIVITLDTADVKPDNNVSIAFSPFQKSILVNPHWI